MKSLRHIENLRGTWNTPSTGYPMNSICGTVGAFVALADSKDEQPLKTDPLNED